MNYFIFVLGITILIITSSDLIKTALSVNGAGFISKRLAKTIWRILLVLNKQMGKRKILEMSGALILTSIIINQILLIWFSASLLFISDINSLMNIETNTATTVVNKIFFIGYTLSTLGMGDIELPFRGHSYSSLIFCRTYTYSCRNYLLNSNCNSRKRKISVYITNIGCSVEDVYYWLLSKMMDGYGTRLMPENTITK